MSVLMNNSTSTAVTDSGVLRILVVDDEQHMCDVCARTLRRGGYHVTTTNDPSTAVELLRGNESFDLLLTDIKMPTMSGLDLAHLARERDPAIAIIIMTGFASMENLHQSVQRGVADFLSKPFELDQLRIAVDQALHKRSLLQDNVRLRAVEQLLENSEALNSTLDLQQLTYILLDVLQQRSASRVGFVLLADGKQLEEPTVRTSGQHLTSDGKKLALEAMQQQQVLLGSHAIFAVDGSRELRHVIATPLCAHGESTGVLIVCDDQPSMLLPGAQEEIALLANYAGVALRNATLYQQLTDAYQRLQELDRLKSEFIAIASHELRTPLSIILGYTMMLRDQQAGDQRDYVLRVMESARRIKDIVDDMVSLRHLETGEEHLTLEEVVAQELLELTVQRFQGPAAERQQTVTVEVPAQPFSFIGDREKLLLTIGNLLANAIRFTPEQGSITLRAWLSQQRPMLEAPRHAIIPPSGAEHAHWVVFEVHDTGIGISEREQTRIFDRFYQVSDSLTRDHGGTGLGLAIVRELVIMFGGCLWIVSQEGQGSTFAFGLPCDHE